MKNTLFENFIDKMEVVYAVLLSWGFAQASEMFTFEAQYTLPLVICGLVLIRFFFAGSHNVKPIAEKTEGRPLQQRVLFLWDIPLLILHSFLYYRMCILLRQRDFVNVYEVLCLLLGFNIIWLISINSRINKYEKKKLIWCSKWTVNNFAHIFFLYAAIRSHWYNWLFWIALSNCIIDFVMTAPLYIGFTDSASGKK